MPVTITVVFSADSNYLFYAAVSIASLAASADKGTFYSIYILCGDELHADNMLSRLEHMYTNISVKTVFVDKSMFANVFINNSHISQTSFYRLVIADMLKEDKCIYIDADTLVNEDLNSLWETDVSGYYMAGCRDIWIDWMSAEEIEQRRLQTGIESMDNYVNAGVLIFNLKKIREDGINEKIREHLSYNYPFEDQDILNVCCYGNILFLPARWNRFSEVYGEWGTMKKCGFPMAEFLEDKGIIHFTNKAGRPWKTKKAWKCGEWWAMAGCLSDTEEYKQADAYTKMQDDSQDFMKLCSYIKKYSHVVIWGYTQQTRQLCDWLANGAPGRQVFFADKDINKQGCRHNGAEVISPSKAYGLRECLYIISVKRSRSEIYKDLQEHGIVARDIRMFDFKTMEYYRMLDQRHYEAELKEIFAKEGISSMPDGTWLQEKYYMPKWILKG